ncbi:MAG: alkaline phosphatase D family protein [Kofleriaceae bacterium]|nr:alkaline phosphatase D family protein [Kofleriaceae bacterium]
MARRIRRREVLAGLGAAAVAACCRRAPAVLRGLPAAPEAVQAGDLDRGRARLWARAAAPGRLRVEWWGPGDRDGHRVDGPRVDAGTDLCGAVEVAGLPAGDVRYQVSLEADDGGVSAATPGRLRVRGAGEPFLLAWSGDVCGQGWGIDPRRGGLPAFAALRRLAPDLFVHSGDAVYADVPIEAAVRLPGGGLWRNLTTAAKAKVAETQAEFWGNHAYNLLDEHYRGLLAEVAMIAQWDDHETLNNWYPGQRLDDDRYQVRDVDTLAARARRAFLDYFAVRRGPDDRIWRAARPHPDVEVIVLDARSARGRNGAGRDAAAGPATAMLGATQAAWLVETLAASTATWKIVACDQPLGLVIPDGPPPPDGAGRQEGFAQGDPGPPLGREHEVAAILAGLRARGVRNVVWLTADVHYAAAHRYDPARAAFHDFDPFWELVAGPLHAGAFGPNPLDPTFGPEVVFARAPTPAQFGSGPAGGLMSFGALAYQPRDRALVARLHGGDGAVLWERALAPA